jgi:DNA-binding MltR family transcriptional regulator
LRGFFVARLAGLFFGFALPLPIFISSCGLGGVNSMHFNAASARYRLLLAVLIVWFLHTHRTMPMARYEPKDIMNILDELKRENDRAVAIVGSSLVEYGLEQAIKAALRPFDPEKEKPDLDRLFGINGIFSGMSAKVLGAYALQIIGPRTRRDLELINKIRNEFAHDMNPLKFYDQNIASRCKEIKLTETSNPAKANDHRGIFLLAIHIYSSALILRLVKDEIPDLDNYGLEMLSWLAL